MRRIVPTKLRKLTTPGNPSRRKLARNLARVVKGLGTGTTIIKRLLVPPAPPIVVEKKIASIGLLISVLIKIVSISMIPASEE